MKHIYVMLSSTQTKFARVIRCLGRQKYNHASIGLDSEFDRVYAFARPQHNALFLGGLVTESLERYTLHNDTPTDVVIFCIPVSDEKYSDISERIGSMLYNPRYMYNLFSVLTHPIFGGFSVKDSFSCVEFAVWLLQSVGYLTDKPRCKYTPDEVARILSDKMIYSGDVRGVLEDSGNDAYFSPFTFPLFKKSVKAFFEIIYRSLFCREKL